MMQFSESVHNLNPTRSWRLHIEPGYDVAFAATGKSGLGHLRRITNIATSLHKINPYKSLGLFTNAAVSGISPDEVSIYKDCVATEKSAIASRIDRSGARLTVVDTAILPGLESISSRLCLILRETMQHRLADFRMPGRPWDLVIVPNPESHWMPSASDINATRVEAVGWIYRETTSKGSVKPTQKRSVRRILLASGGGGNQETAHFLTRETDAILHQLRQRTSFPVEITQALGPRLPDEARSAFADRTIDPGSSLNEIFADYDLVVSTAGYNSVLELATLDVPVVLLPITRTMDDQIARARGWAPYIGFAHEEGEAQSTAYWMLEQLTHRRRRTAVSLDPLGAARAASLIMQLAEFRHDLAQW